MAARMGLEFFFFFMCFFQNSCLFKLEDLTGVDSSFISVLEFSGV